MSDFLCDATFNDINYSRDMLKKHGIFTHGDEQAADVISIHETTIHKILSKFVKDKSPIFKDNDMKQLVIEIIKTIYSNATYPCYINIICDDSDIKVNKIYNGERFIEDEFPIEYRNRKIIQLVLNVVSSILCNVEVKMFIEQYLEPHIVKSYLDGSYQHSIQDIWRTNNTILNLIKPEHMPKYFIPYSLKLQFVDYGKEDDMIKIMDSRYRDKHIEKLLKEHIKNYSLDLCLTD